MANWTPTANRRISSIEYEIKATKPETSPIYVTIKYFPTGSDRSSAADSGYSSSSLSSDQQTLSRTYQTADGATRAVVVSSKRPVLPSGGQQNDGSVREVTGTQDEVFVEQGDAPATSDIQVEVQQLLKQLRRERLAKIGVNVDDADHPEAKSRMSGASSSSSSSPQSWMTRDTLRARRESADSGTASAVASGPDAMTSRVQQSISKMAAVDAQDGGGGAKADGPRVARRNGDNLESVLARFEAGPVPRAAARLRTIVLRDPDWRNIAYEIVESEIGEKAMTARLEKQMKIFQAGAKKGNILDNIPLAFHNWKVKSLFENRAKESRKRGRIQNEVGALGYAVVLPQIDIPENEFFLPKRMFEIRAEHASFPAYKDDRKPAWRSLSLKFQDHDYESPFDLVLHTGRTSPFFNVDSFEDFYYAYDKGPAAFKQYLCSLPVYLEAVIEGIRKDIGSYINVHYYSHVTYDFKAKDGKRRVARFRVVASDGVGDRGRLSTVEQKELWYKLLLNDKEDEEEPRTDLAAEWRHRVADASVTYSLQIQLREWQDGDTYGVYNASRAWDEDEIRWRDLARIRLISPLSDDDLYLTSFNLANVPEYTLGFPEPTSGSDFNVVPYIYKEAYQACFKILPHEPKVLPPGEGVEYLIHVVTADREKAGITTIGSECHVYICLIGSDDRTPFVRLRRTKKDDFTRSSRSTFTVRQRYIGDLQCVKIYKTKRGPDSDWLLDHVIVSTTYNNSCHLLPCSMWFTDQTPLHQIRDGTPTLLDKEASYYLRRQRQAEVTLRQQLFRWRDQTLDARYAGLPGYIDAGDDLSAIPRDLMPDHVQTLLDDWNKHLRNKNNVFKTLRDFLLPNSWKGKTVEDVCRYELNDDLPDFEEHGNLHYVMNNWKSDSEFSRQILNGVLPQKVRQLKDLPPSFPVTDDMVKELLEGSTLEAELNAGRLYIVSYPELEKYAARQLEEDGATPDGSSSPSDKEEKGKKDRFGKRYLCAPMVLFHRKHGDLRPLAIQLTQRPAVDPVIYTPSDGAGEFSNWQVAKMWVRVAESNVQQFVGRLLGVHLTLEPVAVALARNLPAVHPVSRLIGPCVAGAPALGAVYRKCALAADGALAEVTALGAADGVELMREAAAELRGVAALNPTECFCDNGTLHPKELTGYRYRDDCLALWEATRDFVIDVVCLHYDDDEQVAGDVELDAMLRDLHRNGFHGGAGASERVTSIEELVLFCTSVLFHATVQYAAYTRGMLDVYGFCLNAPPCLMRAPPAAKQPGGYTSGYIRSLLPPSELQERYIGTMLLMLKGLKNPKMTLGYYPRNVFTDEKAVIALKSFQKQLHEFSARVRQRESQTKGPRYDYLLPENIPAGIIA